MTLTSPRLLLLALVAVALLTGFAPFDSDGLLRLQITDGEGPVVDEGAVRDPVDLEAEPLFHSLSSRFGGGGVLIYAEFTPAQAGFSGLFLMDLRHAGLADLQRATVEATDRRRVELYYQEWDGGRDLFEGDRVEGTVTVEDLFRGDRASAIAISFDLTFFDAGPDGRLNTDDDRWRRLRGSLASSPTVTQAVNNEPDLVRARRETTYAPDGDVYVSCVGESDIEEREYNDETYVYEDDDGGGCSGDTWDDDTDDPQESGGCAGEQTLDDGEPDPDSGCESGDEYDDSEDEDPYYSGDEYDDGSGCDETDDGSDDSDDSVTSGCDDTDDGGEGDEFGEGAGWGAGRHGPRQVARAAGVCGAGVGAVMSPARREALRRYLDQLHQPQRHAALLHRFDRETTRTLQRLLRYLPFVLLGLFLHAWRRRLRAA
jgi:hypothetical protein